MDSMRFLAVLFLCFCVALSGTAVAAPMAGIDMEKMVATTTMDAACPDMADVIALPAAHDGVAPVDGTKPDCCRSGHCQCVAAHFTFVAFAPVPLPGFPPLTTTVATFGGSGYSSPALARLVRPPIA